MGASDVASIKLPQHEEELDSLSHSKSVSAIVNIFDQSFSDMEMFLAKQKARPNKNIASIYSIFPNEDMIEEPLIMGDYEVNAEYLESRIESESQESGGNGPVTFNLDQNILTNVRDFKESKEVPSTYFTTHTHTHTHTHTPLP
jgi:hypothetical protein